MKKEQMISDRLIEKAPLIKDMVNKEYMNNNGYFYLDIAVDDNKKLSYITKDRLDKFNGDFWNPELRQKYAYMGRIGRVLNKSIEGCSYDDIMYVTNSLIDKSKYKISVVTGRHIPYYYAGNHCYNSGQGDLMSCMSHVPASYFNIYQKLCSMVVVTNTEGLCVGRSLIFHNVKQVREQDGKYEASLFRNGDVACRIYYAYSFIKDMIGDFLEKEDIPRFNSGYDASAIILGDERWELSDNTYIIETSQDKVKHSRYPYIDNLNELYFGVFNDMAILATDSCQHKLSKLYDTDYRYEADLCDTEGYPRDAYYTEMCEQCMCSGFCEKMCCEGYDNYHEQDDDYDYDDDDYDDDYDGEMI